ncbi:MAG: hypothetical protein K2P43_06180 [Lachnospiraceae bacterium]|nr:hypothetical protein [Lachnospiraceae bacterium]
MNRTKRFPSNIDLVQEFTSENYEKIICCADDAQRELIYHWHVKDSLVAEQLILMSRSILNFWTDSIIKNRLWTALIRCGAWIGTLETIEKHIYEKNMDSWSQKRIYKNLLSIKHFDEILRLLEVKGVMTHGEMVEKLHLNNSSTLTEIIKKTRDFDIIDIKKSGKYKLYSLTDAGVRYARQIRSGEDRQHLLKNIIEEYGLNMDEKSLDSRLGSMNQEISVKPGQRLKVKIDNSKIQDTEIDNIIEAVKPYNKKEPVSSLKTKKTLTEELFNYEMEA